VVAAVAADLDSAFVLDRSGSEKPAVLLLRNNLPLLLIVSVEIAFLMSVLRRPIDPVAAAARAFVLLLLFGGAAPPGSILGNPTRSTIAVTVPVEAAVLVSVAAVLLLLPLIPSVAG
jgi:hypothetical protein